MTASGAAARPFGTAPPPASAEASSCEGPRGALIPVDIALARGMALADPVAEVETLPLEAAIGRVLAGPAVAPIPLPSFDNSAMDGYAVRLEALTGAGPWRLRVAGRVAAGDDAGAARTGEALRILTGAPVPPGFGAVVMQEHVDPDGDWITLTEAPRRGCNIRRIGEDAPSGAEILPGGVVIGAREAAALAAIGAARVEVRRKLCVAIFCTGSELVQPGEPLSPGRIYNSNRFALLAALTRPWIEVRDLGAVPDRPATLAGALKDAADCADVVVSTGGVSVGDEDHMPRLLREAGGDIHAMKVAMKPGKPLAIGRMGDAIYLGLPGNPVAAFTTWMVIGARIAARRAGIADGGSSETTVRAAFALDRRPGRREYRPARIVGREPDGARMVELLDASFSARIAHLASADGLAILPAEAVRIEKGSPLRFLDFD